MATRGVYGWSECKKVSGPACCSGAAGSNDAARQQGGSVVDAGGGSTHARTLRLAGTIDL